MKKGDPFSPTLFIIAAEVLARGLNSLWEDGEFIGYGIPNRVRKKIIYHMQMTQFYSVQDTKNQQRI